MKLLVYPHSMEVGGSQLNAVQLAAAVRDRGHEVIIAAEPGPLSERLRDMGLEHIEIPRRRRRPSPTVIAQILHVIRKRKIDVVHGYEWPPVIDAFFGPLLLLRIPVVGTVLSMSVCPFFPRSIPLVVGTEAIRQAAVASGHHQVTLIEPPVDTDADNPDVDGTAFRAKHQIKTDEVLIVMICRLVPELKLEGLLSTCEAVRDLSLTGSRVRLLIVGDGRSRPEVSHCAAIANRAAGREVITLTGEILDPRPAYAACDIAVGQGGSALRGMAFGKPLVVVGENGFSETLTAASAPLFLKQGWYGLGPGSLGIGVPALRAALQQLVTEPARRKELGLFSRNLVEQRFSLRLAAEVQERIYLDALQNPIPATSLAKDCVRSAAGLSRNYVARKIQRLSGKVSIDDSNARAVVSQSQS